MKYLPRGSLEVCSAGQSEILMDYSMIGPFGYLRYFARFFQFAVDWFL